MQCVILVGGLGTRLGELTRECPKPMLDVGGRPFLDRLIENAARFGAKRFLLLAGYFADVVRNHFPHGVFRANGQTVTVEVLTEPAPLGTGGALRFAKDHLDPEFLMLNGDSLFSFNWLDLFATPLPSHAAGCIALRRVENAARYGAVDTDATSCVTRMIDGSAVRGPADINGGVYRLRRSVLQYIDEERAVSLEREVFPKLIAANGLFARRHDGLFIDIGVPEDYAAAQSLPLSRRGAVFFDRDGVLNEDGGYVHRIEDLRWRPNAQNAVRLVNDLDLYTFVVTNQAGVARGLYTEGHVRRLHSKMQADLLSIGAHIDDFRYCPHHPEASLEVYRAGCSWRKPGSGMLLDILANWDIDIQRSLLVGDKDSDIAAAKPLGIRCMRVDPEEPMYDLAAALREAI